VRVAVDRDLPLWELPVEAYRAVHPAFDEDVLRAVALEAAVENKRVPGGTARAPLADQLAALREALRRHEAWHRGASASLRRAGELAG